MSYRSKAMCVYVFLCVCVFAYEFTEPAYGV